MARLALLVLTSLLAVPTAAEAAPRPIPLVSCVDRAASGGQVAVFQARLGGRHAVRVRTGSDNRVTGGRVVGKHRQVFKPGRHTVLRVRFRSGSTAIRWRLRGRTATAAGRTSSCLRDTPQRVGGAQPAPPAAPAPAEPPVTAVGISADPELQPAFAAGTPDYVTRCGGSKPVTMKVATPEDKPVSVDGNPAQIGRFEVPSALQAGSASTSRSAPTPITCAACRPTFRASPQRSRALRRPSFSSSPRPSSR